MKTGDQTAKIANVGYKNDILERISHYSNSRNNKPIMISNILKSKPQKPVFKDEIDDIIDNTSQGVSTDLQKKRLSYMTKKACSNKVSFSIDNRTKS